MHTCDCHSPNNLPLMGLFLASNVVQRARNTVAFKNRYRASHCSFSNIIYSNSTNLASYTHRRKREKAKY